MSRSFRETLRAAVKQMARRTPLAQLRKQGVKEVDVLGIDRVVGMIEEAVHRGLKSRLYGIEREAVADATKAEFLRLLRSNEDLQRTQTELERLKARAEDEVDQLRRELEAQKQLLAQRLEEGRRERRLHDESQDARITAQVGELFREFERAPGTDLAALQDKVLELVMSLLGRERAAVAEVESALRDREVGILQRRIQKLGDTLTETERRLREVAALKHLDQGISSVYRQVQGLTGSEPDYRRRRELMAEIFEANLRLQRKQGGETVSGATK